MKFRFWPIAITVRIRWSFASYLMIRNLRNQSELQASRASDPNFAGTLAKGLMILQEFVREPRPHAGSSPGARWRARHPGPGRRPRSWLQLASGTSQRVILRSAAPIPAACRAFRFSLRLPAAISNPGSR